MISWADHAEDVVLGRALPAGYGTFVDVGAGDPDEGSATRVLAERGWYGISIAPDPAVADRHRRRRPADVTLELPAGASAGRSLDTVLEDFAKGKLDLLRIGSAAPAGTVLAGVDLARWRPRVVLVEVADPRTGAPAPGAAALDALGEAGYRQALFDGVNRFFAAPGDEELLGRLGAPASPADGYVPWTTVRQEEAIAALRRRVEHLERLLQDRSAAVSGSGAVAVRHPLHVPDPPRGLRPRAARPAPASPAPPPAARVAVVGAPGAAADWLRRALSAALDAPGPSADHPADVDWHGLPDRFVLGLPWPRTRLLEQVLAERGIVAVSPARRPAGAVADLEPPAGASAGDDWLAWATGAEVAAVLGRTVGWWATPATVRVRWEDLTADPPAALSAVLDACGLVPAADPSAVTAAVGPPPASALPAGVAEQVDAAHATVATRLGYAVAGTGLTAR